jgi:hypothetical protein
MDFVKWASKCIVNFGNTAKFLRIIRIHLVPSNRFQPPKFNDRGKKRENFMKEKHEIQIFPNLNIWSTSATL